MKKKLLKILICPICHKKLFLNLEKNELICNLDHVVFPIEKGIPILLKERSKNLDHKITEK